PLPRTRFGREPFVPFPLRVPGLGQRRVDLVTPRRAVEFRLVVEPRRGAEALLEPPSPDQRPGPTRLAVEILDLRRNLDPPLGRVLLAQALGQEELRQRLDAGRTGLRVSRGRQGLRQVRLNVVPLGRSLFLGELDDESVGLRHTPTNIRLAAVSSSEVSRFVGLTG